MIRQDLISRPARCSPRISTPVLPITYAGPLPRRDPPQCEAQPTKSCPTPLNPYSQLKTPCPCQAGTRPNLGAVGGPCLHAGTNPPCTGAVNTRCRGTDRGPGMQRSGPAYEQGPGCPPGAVCQKRDNFPSPCQASGPAVSTPAGPCQCVCSACGERCPVTMPSDQRNSEKSACLASPPPPPMFGCAPGQMGPPYGAWTDGGPARRGRPRCDNQYLDPQLKDILDFRRRVLDEQMACAEAQNYELYQPPVWYYYDVHPSGY